MIYTKTSRYHVDNNYLKDVAAVLVKDNRNLKLCLEGALVVLRAIHEVDNRNGKVYYKQMLFLFYAQTCLWDYTNGNS